MEKNNKLMSGSGEKGKWITVNGAHVFVEDGQSVNDAVEKHFSKKATSSSSMKKDNAFGVKEQIEQLNRVEEGIRSHINTLETDIEYGVYKGDNKAKAEKLLEEYKESLKRAQDKKNELSRSSTTAVDYSPEKWRKVETISQARKLDKNIVEKKLANNISHFNDYFNAEKAAERVKELNKQNIPYQYDEELVKKYVIKYHDKAKNSHVLTWKELSQLYEN